MLGEKTRVWALLLCLLCVVHSIHGKDYCKSPEEADGEEDLLSETRRLQNDEVVDHDHGLEKEKTSYQAKDELPEDRKVTDKESSMPQNKLSIYAETNRLKAGSWCVSVGYRDLLGPRLVAVVWFQFGSKVAYSVLRSKAGECPPLSQQISIDVTADTQFSIHFNFIPGIQELGKDNVEIRPGECKAPDMYVHLDESHGERLLTCNFRGQANLRFCDWQAELDMTTEDPGADVAQWIQRPDKSSLGSEDDGFMEDVSRLFLSSPPLVKLASPGCLHLWLYAWGRAPEGLTVYLHELGAEADGQVTWREVKLPKAALVTWREERILLDVPGEYGVTVELHTGGEEWTGSLVLDDISREGVPCTPTTPQHYIIPHY